MHFCRIMGFIVVIMILVLAMPDIHFDVAFCISCSLWH